MSRGPTKQVHTPADDTPAGGAELVTGVPIVPGVPEGSNQFAAYEAEERRRGDAELLARPAAPIEDRDNRGDIVQSGKSDARIPIYEVDRLAEVVAGEISPNFDKVSTELGSNSVTVVLTTRHGTSRATATVDDWTEAGVRKAMKSVKAQMLGEERPAGDEPKDRLADAIREIAGRPRG